MIPTAPLFTVHCADDATGMRGFLVVHSVRHGSAVGGVRAAEDMTVDEVGRLARVMTYKYAFWERPVGGAKAGVVLPEGVSPERRRRLFAAFGRHLAPLLRADLYRPWTDLNCFSQDVEAILAGAGLATYGLPDSSYHTALTVFGALRATVEFMGLQPGHCRTGIEGMGHVGTHLARELAAWGGKLVVASTAKGAVFNERGLDVDALARASDAHGEAFVTQPGDWERLSRDDLFRTPLDVIVPCARVGSINDLTASDLQVRAVVPAANAPCTDEAEAALTQRGVMVLPDFVCNSGGVMGTRLEGFGVAGSRLRRLVVDEFAAMVARMLRQSAEGAISPAALARRVTEDLYQAVPAEAAGKAGLWNAAAGRLARRVPRAYRRRQACREFLRVANSRFGGPAR